MFLGGLKAKSVVRKIKELIANRSYKQATKPIKKIGVLQSFDKPLSEDELKMLAQSFTVTPDKIEVLTYIK